MDTDRWGALHYAAYYGFETVLSHLLSHPQIQRNKYLGTTTAINFAIRGSHNECIRILLGHKDTDPNLPPVVKKKPPPLSLMRTQMQQIKIY